MDVNKREKPSASLDDKADSQDKNNSGRQPVPLCLRRWTPQQMLAWTGLLRYSYQEDAERLVYKWLYMIRAFVKFNGVYIYT